LNQYSPQGLLFYTFEDKTSTVVLLFK